MQKKIQEEIKSVVKDLFDLDQEISIEKPNDPTFGDLSTNVAMQLAGELKRNPVEIAEEIEDKLGDIDGVDSVEVVKPGFINFKVSSENYTGVIDQIVDKKEEFGRTKLSDPPKYVLEHTSPNPNKALSLAHLRNSVTSMAVGKIWEFAGIDVIYDCIYNDRGIAIAKLMWGYLRFANKKGEENHDIKYWSEHKDEWTQMDELEEKPDKFMSALYVKGSEDVKNNEDSEEKVRQMVRDWEAGDEINHELWKHVLEFIYKGHEETLKRLGNHWDNIWYESEVYELGKDLVQEGKRKGIFQILEDGAILTDLKKDYGLEDTIVQRADGTSLYITQEIGLDKEKFNKFEPDKLFWVLGPDHNLWLRQVSAVNEQLGTGKLDNFVHLSYGYVSIKGQGKMSSRSGNVVYADDLLDLVKGELKKRLRDNDFDEDQIDETAEKLALASVKYSILKVGRNKEIEYDFESSISTEGDSAPYILYTYARARSALRKSKEEINWENLEFTNDSEVDILKHLSGFSDTVKAAAKNYAPNQVCKYVYDLAVLYNKFYNSLSILNADLEEQKNSRLALTAATAQVLKNGLGLLGIETVERM